MLKLRCTNKFLWIFTRKVWYQQSLTFIIMISKLIELASCSWADVKPYKEWLIKFMKFFQIWTMFKLHKQLGEKVFVFRKVMITDEHRWWTRGISFHLDEISVIWLSLKVFTYMDFDLCVFVINSFAIFFQLTLYMWKLCRYFWTPC